uniref:Uncharacterized protein n=1 Tax=Brassica oleracea TaxID=3712 RepID=A0A3P6H6S4_BRAOL|nr:unnamed protein product [Brassica oleracea]
MVVYPAQTIYLSIVGCKLLQLMRKGFTWKLDQSMRIRIQVLLLEPSSLLMILRGELAVRSHCSICFRNRALWLYLQEVHGRRKRRCKGVSRYRFLRFFLHPLRFLHRQFICRCKDNGKATLDYDFQGFLCLHHSSCSYFSFDFIVS